MDEGGQACACAVGTEIEPKKHLQWLALSAQIGFAPPVRPEQGLSLSKARVEGLHPQRSIPPTKNNPQP